MNSRAQSALEYLMTYGWALIVIAVIVGLIVVVLTSVTQGGVTCATNTTNFNLQEYAVVTGANGAKFVIQNASGKSVSGVNTHGSNDFNPAGDTNTLAGTFTKGQNFVIAVAGPTATGNFTNGQVQVQYDWPSLQDINFKILCSGTL